MMMQIDSDFFRTPTMRVEQRGFGARHSTHYLQEARVMPKGATRLATKCRPMRQVPVGDQITEDWKKVDCKECLRRRYFD